jgi:large subunit ribosomal protein L25
MPETVLHAETRETTGHHAKGIRKEGKIPGVFYARGEKNVNLQVSRLSLDPLVFTSEAHVIDLRLPDGSSRKCILRNVQFDPVTDRPIHFDLQGVRENERIMIEVPVILTGGTPRGVREGGMVQHIIHRLKISCLPRDIPERIEVNIADLQINHSVHVSELQMPDVTILDSPESTIVAVLPPTVEKVVDAAAAAQEAITEPEVVGKGKKAEEGEEEAEAPKTEAKPAAKPEAKPAAKEEKKEKK